MTAADNKNATQGTQMPPIGKHFLIGGFLEGLSLVLIWILVVALSPARASCISGVRNVCLAWQIFLLLMTLFLAAISAFAIFEFRAIPNHSIPPEKLIGIVAGSVGLLSALVIAWAILSGRFI